MKKYHLLICILSVILSGCAVRHSSPPPRTITVAAAGKSNYQIVMPDKFDNVNTGKYLRECADFLRKAFAESVKADVPICQESSMQPGRPAIYIGDCAALRRQNINPEKFQGVECIVAVRGDDIFLAGRDRHATGSKKADHYSYYDLGSVRAAVDFMEKELGVCFAYPGEVGMAVPERQTVTIEANTTRHIRPQLICALGRPQTLMYDYSNNNFGRGSFFMYGGHSYYDAVPAKKYAVSHPEYFAFLSGKRNPAGNHLCITNPDVKKLVYAEMLKRLDAGAETVELAQTDGYRPCECAACKAYGNTDNPGEKLWIFHRELAEQLLRDRPGKNVMIISYGPTAEPPRTFKAFPENVMVEICSYTPENFAAWSKVKVPRGFTVYIYNWGSYARVGHTPKLTPEYSKKQINMFFANNVRGLYRCGFGENMGLEGPNYYVYGKLFDDPSQNVVPLLEKFYTVTFGAAAGPMRVFYNTLFERLSGYMLLHESGALPLNPRIILAYIYSPELLDIMDKNLERAEHAATTAPVKKRLSLVRAEFEYAKNLASIIHLYNAYRIRPNKANFDQLAELVDARNVMVNGFFDAKGQLKPLPGWPDISFMGRESKQQILENGCLSGKLGAPFTWNTALLRSKNILPGVGMKTMDIVKASAKVTLSDLRQGVWAAAEFHELGGLQLGEIREKSRFKVLYDTKNIYFGVEGDLPAGRKYNPCGDDGACWEQDCLEFVLDPHGSREIYYHMIYNPVAESRFDAAFGLIKDVLDPRFNNTDSAWNGDWSYQTERRGDKWYSLLTVPFRTLGVNMPQPGTRWTLNVARESFLKPKSDPELSSWSPNLETLSFHDRDSFGEAVFR